MESLLPFDNRFCLSWLCPVSLPEKYIWMFSLVNSSSLSGDGSVCILGLLLSLVLRKAMFLGLYSFIGMLILSVSSKASNEHPLLELDNLFAIMHSLFAIMHSSFNIESWANLVIAGTMLYSSFWLKLSSIVFRKWSRNDLVFFCPAILISSCTVILAEVVEEEFAMYECSSSITSSSFCPFSSSRHTNPTLTADWFCPRISLRVAISLFLRDIYME